MWNWQSKKRRFDALASDDEHGEYLLPPANQPPNQRGHTNRATILLLIATSIFSALFGAIITSVARFDADSFSIRHTSQYCESLPSLEIVTKKPYALLLKAAAPILDEVHVEYSEVRFNGSLLRSNVFRQHAGPEVDAAWKSLGADCRSTCLLSPSLNVTNRTSQTVQQEYQQTKQLNLACQSIKSESKTSTAVVIQPT